MSGKFRTTWFYSSLDTYKKKVGILKQKEEDVYSERSGNNPLASFNFDSICLSSKAICYPYTILQSSLLLL